MRLTDLPAELRADILSNVAARMAMRLLRAGISLDSVLAQEPPPPDGEEGKQIIAAVHYLVSHVVLESLESDYGGNA